MRRGLFLSRKFVASFSQIYPYKIKLSSCKWRYLNQTKLTVTNADAQ